MLKFIKNFSAKVILLVSICVVYFINSSLYASYTYEKNLLRKPLISADPEELERRFREGALSFFPDNDHWRVYSVDGWSRQELREFMLSIENEDLLQSMTRDRRMFRGQESLVVLHGFNFHPHSKEMIALAQDSKSLRDFEILDIGAGYGLFLADVGHAFAQNRASLLREAWEDNDVQLNAFEIEEMREEIDAMRQHNGPSELKSDGEVEQWYNIRWSYGATAENLPFADNSFALATTTRVIEYTYDVLRAIEEMYRVIKNGGRASIVLSLLNNSEYKHQKKYIDSRPDLDQISGHIYLEGIDIFEEIERLKEEGYDIGIYVARYLWEYDEPLLAVDEELKGRFNKDFRTKEFNYPYFVIVIRKWNSGKGPLTFPYVLTGVDNSMHRRYVEIGTPELQGFHLKNILPSLEMRRGL